MGLVCLLFIEKGYTQFSKTHYIPPLTASDNNVSVPQEQYLYISTPTTTDVNVKIIPVGGTPFNRTVSNAAPLEIYIANQNNSQLVVNSNNTGSKHSNKGYIIEADDQVYVTIRLLASNGYAQAGGLVSKGLAALGKTFRVGAFTSQSPTAADDYLSFVSVMATEDNTEVSFSDLSPGVTILNNTPTTTTLNTGQSYIVALKVNVSAANSDGLIGALVESTKPVAVNCGSFNGSNDDGGGRDIGIDQIVPVERIGNEYIFIRAKGYDEIERPLIVAHEDDTEVFIDGSTTPLATLNAGEYIAIHGSNYGSNSNMYVNTSKNVFAFQGIGGIANEPNQGLFFVPPLNCQTPRVVDNIPYINNVGSRPFSGGITVVTEAGAAVTINGTDIASWGGVKQSITGNSDYETYIVEGLSGHVAVRSTKQVYVAYFGANGSAAFGGYYSGFAFKPEIILEEIDITQVGTCIPNVELSLSSISSYDTYQWFHNGTPIPGANQIKFTPTEPGYYYVEGEIIGCPTNILSDNIPVSACATDVDNDGINDNIDIDNDNDGISNCNESFGDQHIDLSNLTSGVIPVGGYSYTGQTSTIGNVALTPLIGLTDGTFRSSIPALTGDEESSVTYEMNFNTEVSLSLEYATNDALGGGLLTNDEEFILRVPFDKTITVLNPDNQLLIDTNYDGIYETGVTEFSSFEMRFRLNSSSLAFGTGTFKFLTNLTTSFTYIHKNLSETLSNEATFKITATCVPRDHDNDGIEDALDLDSDNDGIPDIAENIGDSSVQLSMTDANGDGMDDVFDSTAAPIDSDSDGIPNFMDLDSDNDGIYDLEESGSQLNDLNFDGFVDNVNATIGTNGWVDAAEQNPDDRTINFSILNTDGDTDGDYFDSDSDNDVCFDVIEAGFSDDNGDTFLGNSAVTVDGFGRVTNGSDGYSTPHVDYITAAPISIQTQPENQEVCELSTFQIAVESSAVDSYQWEMSTDGVNWSAINDTIVYQGTSTSTLIFNVIPPSFNNHQYRVFLHKNGNSCGLYSDEITVLIQSKPVVIPMVELKQCDNDTDGFSAFNLNEANAKISTNYVNETFAFYTSLSDAQSETNAIPDPTAYVNQTASTDTVWVLVKSTFGCSEISQLNLFVSTTGIPSTFVREFYQCDDYLDDVNNERDGIAAFDFSSVTQEVIDIFPPGQPLIIKYYRNEADALAELNEISDPSNYRNIGYPGTQDIYVRVDSEIDNDCLGFGVHVKLTVESLPIAYPVTIARQCDDDQDGLFPFDSSFIDATLLNGQTGVTITYFDESGNPLPSPLPNPFLSPSQTITARLTNTITNAPNGPCFEETTIEFTVDVLPIAHPVILAEQCDDDLNDTDGFYEFDTATIEASILNGQTGMEVYYYDGNGNPLPSPLPNPFNTSTQDVLVEVVNPINSSCTATTTLNFVVNPLPDFDVVSDLILCITEPKSTIYLDFVQSDNSELLAIEWHDFSGNLIGTDALQPVSDPGTYYLTLTKTDGTACSRTKEIIVNPSEAPTLTLNDLDIVDDSQNNSITINTTNLGLGDYEYSLNDDLFGYQDEPVFQNVPAGIHTIYVRDKNNCGMTSLEVSVVGFPAFFTPNGDGYNDEWNVLGIHSNFYTNATIHIFDRFGKLLISYPGLNSSWNGIFNGEALPATDYWFTAELVDLNGKIRYKKGHFSLIRR